MVAPFGGEVIATLGGLASTVKKMLLTPAWGSVLLPKMSEVEAENEYCPVRSVLFCAFGKVLV
jgi:hypothetical protein